MPRSVDPDRLRQLVDTLVTIGSDLDLPAVLERIVQGAVDLVDARYGALGVLDPSRTRLAQFITVGVSDEVRATIGPPPEGHGILGLLILDAEPLRLSNLTEHPDIGYGPPGFCQQFLHGAHWGRREQGRHAGVRGVANNTGNRLQAQFGGLRSAHQHHGGGAVGDRRRVGRGDRAIFLESRFQSRDFVDIDGKRAFILVDHDITLAASNRRRRYFPGKTTIVASGLGAGGRTDGKLILRFAGETVSRGAFFGKSTHQTTTGFLGIGIFEAIHEHVVEHLAVAEAITTACRASSGAPAWRF